MPENKNDTENLGELLKIRRDKLTALQEAGQDPFQITKFEKKNNTQEIRDNFEAMEEKPVPALPPLAQRLDTALRQFELAKEDKGEHIACLEARKHLCWYLHGVPHAGYYKKDISQVSTSEEVYTLIKLMKRDLR